MIEIDMMNWNRKQHFDFFGRSDLPFYNVNLDLDITGVKEYTKSKHISLNNMLMYLVLKSMTAIDNFRYRIRAEKVVLHEMLHPVFAHIKAPDNDLFMMVAANYNAELAAFNTAIKTTIQRQRDYFALDVMQGRDDFVFFSSLPWFSFTAIDHTLNLNKNDGIPRVTWGKIKTSGHKEYLPFNIQVNHRLVDGVHIGYLLDEINVQIKAITING